MNKKTESIYQNKIVIWLITILIVVVMSSGVYLTHPLKKHIFDGALIFVWVIISLIIIPVAIITHYLLRNYLIEKKLDGGKGSILNYRLLDILSDSGNGFIGCTAAFEDFTVLTIVIIGVIIALFLGVIFAPLLLVVEFLINKLADLDKTQLGYVHWAIILANIFIILYGTYFISLLVVTRFLS